MHLPFCSPRLIPGFSRGPTTTTRASVSLAWDIDYASVVRCLQHVHFVLRRGSRTFSLQSFELQLPKVEARPLVIGAGCYGQKGHPQLWLFFNL